MHEQHDVFEAPVNPDVPIWRYMDLAKFISMLNASTLHFARSDTMVDKFEGSVSRPTAEQLAINTLAEDATQEDIDKFNNDVAYMRQTSRNRSFLNCWHMNEAESAAMWSIYQSGEPRGIAVRSTYQRLSAGITDERHVYIGVVQYIDYDTDPLPAANLFYPYVHKRRSFDYEREIRAFHSTWAQDAGGQLLPTGPPVIPISVDLDTLVEAVYVSPDAPAWFADVVQSVIVKSGRSWEVQHSDLDRDPLY